MNTLEQLQNPYYMTRSRQLYLAPLMPYFRGSKLILDAGCGSGWLGEAFKRQLSATIVSVDLRRQSLKGGLDNPARMDVQFLGFTEAFDMVIAKDLLEHLVEPMKALEQFAAVLKPDGKLFVNVPTPGAPYFWDDCTHVRPYTKISIAQLLDETGFELLYCRYLGRPTFGAALFRYKGLVDALAERGIRRGDLVAVARKKPPPDAPTTLTFLVSNDFDVSHKQRT